MRSIFRLPLAFSLRTLLVLISLICGWLAWERHLVIHRKEVLAEVERLASIEPNDECGPYTPKVSRLRLLLGDVDIERFSFRVECGEEVFKRTRRAFPEAEVERFDRHQR
jgi:hypothetical protein